MSLDLSSLMLPERARDTNILRKRRRSSHFFTCGNQAYFNADRKNQVQNKLVPNLRVAYSLPAVFGQQLPALLFLKVE